MSSVIVNGALTARAHERITATTAAVGLTATKYEIELTSIGSYNKIRRAEEVLITVETADIRWTMDGTTPTTTATTAIGHIASLGTTIQLSGHAQIKAFRCINAVASSGASIQASVLFRE